MTKTTVDRTGMMSNKSSYLEQIVALWSPPSRRRHTGAIEGFDGIEEQLGFVLPSDYKELVHTYGNGVWFDTIRVFNPFADRDLTGLTSWSKNMQQLRKGSPTSFELPIFPELGGLFPWATFTSIFGNLYWLTDGSPDKWPTLYGSNILTEFDLERHDVSSTQLLWQLATASRALDGTRLNSVICDVHREMVFQPI